MADEQDQSEKTEDPSQRRLDEAIKRGDVAKSVELPAFLVLFTATFLVIIGAAPACQYLSKALAALLANAHAIPTDGEHLRLVVLQIGLAILAALGLPLIALMVAGVAGNMLQHPLIWSFDPIQPNFAKVSPLAGLKRLFSSQSLVGFVKGLIKLVTVGVAIGFVLWPERDRLELLVASDVRSILPVTRDLVIKLLGAVAVMMFLVAVADYVYQRFSWLKKHRMSIKDLKDEFKQQEGSPEIKAKLRQIRRERARKRMMAEVPKATVVITNPTHFAVALRYETGMPAPICLAKGIDHVALKIRERATGAGVMIVENPPLARVLYASVEIDEEIPAEHYKAVAQVIGYVMSLKAKRGWRAA